MKFFDKYIDEMPLDDFLEPPVERFDCDDEIRMRHYCDYVDKTYKNPYIKKNYTVEYRKRSIEGDELISLGLNNRGFAFFSK